MKNLLLLGLALIILSANSCKKPDDKTKGDLKIIFKAFYETDPLVVFNDYQTPDGHNLQVHVLNFFLSHIELVKENDEVLRLKDIAFIDFNINTDLDKATAGISITFDEIAVGSFKTLRFGVGMEPGLNAKEPGDYSTDPYLGDLGNYWTAWNSYIFSRIEGRLDTLPAQAGGDVFYLYHSGVDGMYQQRSFSKNFSIEGGKTKELEIHLNVKDVFYKDGARIYIPDANVSHSGAVGTAEYDLVKQVIANIAAGLILQ